MREPGKSKQPQTNAAAGEEGFADSERATDGLPLWRSRPSAGGSSRDPIVISLFLVSLFAAFMVLDYSQLKRETMTRLDLTVRLIAAELANSTPTSAPALLAGVGRDTPPGFEIYLTDANGRLIVATGQVEIDAAFDDTSISAGKMSSRANIDGPLGDVIVAIKPVTALSPMIGHMLSGGAALAILIFIAWRRPAKLKSKPSTDKPENDEARIIAELPAGIAHWSETGELLGCNSSYKEYLSIDSKTSGLDYLQTMNMVTERDTCLVLRDDDCRLLEISTSEGTTLLIDERPLADGQFITQVLDISALRQAEQTVEDVRDEQRVLAQQLLQEKFKAEAASRAKTSFLAHLSHDVRTPLNHIIGFADLVAHQTYGPVGDKRYLNYINDIKGSGEQLLNSFTEILELAQIEGGHLVLRRERFELAEAIKSTANRFMDNAKRAGLAFDISMPEDIVLYTDRHCLERMLGNIIENAIRFTPNGGSVKLSAWVAEDGAVFEVTDTGIGISHERLADLDQPFVLGDAAFTRDSAGIGLGIAISRAIAELSGGELMIDSSPAVGTTVAISLPAKVLATHKSAKTAAA